jgi:hypothetical protein
VVEGLFVPEGAETRTYAAIRTPTTESVLSSQRPNMNQGRPEATLYVHLTPRSSEALTGFHSRLTQTVNLAKMIKRSGQAYTEP